MIRAKVGQCSDCQKEYPLTKGRCQYCYWKHRAKVRQSEKALKEKTDPPVEETKKVYVIPKQTDKRKKQNALYLKKRRIFMEQNTNCQAKLKGCTGKSTELHHQKGRLEDLIHDERYFLAVCSNCHRIITEHSKLAFEKGLSLLRYGS